MKFTRFLLATAITTMFASNFVDARAASPPPYAGHHTYYNMILGDGTPMPTWNANITTYLSTPLRFVNGSIYRVDLHFPEYTQEPLTQKLFQTRHALRDYMEGYELLQKVKYDKLSLFGRFFSTIPLLLTDPRRTPEVNGQKDEIIQDLKTIKGELESKWQSIRDMISQRPHNHLEQMKRVEYLLVVYHNFLYLLEAITNGPVVPSNPRKSDLRTFFFTKPELARMAEDKEAYFRSLLTTTTTTTTKAIPMTTTTTRRPMHRFHRYQRKHW